MKRTMNIGVPEFESPEEEREYWEAHGPLAEGHEGQLNKPRRGQKRSSFLAVRLTGEELMRLRDLAAKQGMGPSTFARLILTASIQKERKLPKVKTMPEIVETIKTNLSPEVRERMLAIIESVTIGKPPYLLELTKEQELEELWRLSVAMILAAAGVQFVEVKESLGASAKT